MSSIDLNIVDRGIKGTVWTAEEQGITADSLDDVVEQKTDNSGALNSLPTPFARFFVAKEAFRRAKEEYLNDKKEAGYAYRQLVSDILDVFEMLFNLKHHKNNSWKNGEKLELREWNCKENLEYLHSKMPILYNSLKDYYKTDIAEKSLYFLVFSENGKDKLLACSSPYTGFVTPPDMDKSITKDNGTSCVVFSGKQYQGLHLLRKSGGEYFRDIKMFEKRSEDFKNYMYQLFSSDDIDDRYKSIRDYIRSFKNDEDIRNNYVQNLAPVMTDQNDALVINDLPIMSSDEVDINSYFTSTLIKVPYRIARDKFKAVVYQNDTESRDYDYLLPFKPETLSLFANGDIASSVHINRNSVTVSLEYNGKVYKKDYSVDQYGEGCGRIVDLKAAKVNFDLGIFPNILSYKEQENNYFKIQIIAADKDSESPNLMMDNVSLRFYKQDDNKYSLIKEMDPSTSGAHFGVLPAVVRSVQKDKGMEGGTKMYELFNSSFDAIEISLLGDSGLIIPVWEKSKPTNDVYTYAIDLGTSNTFISRSKKGENVKPELFKMERPMVNYLHEVPEDAQISLSRRIENSIFEEAKNKIKTEFVPSIIDGMDYKFPIRTALCYIKNCSDKPKLFDNHNIAFFYEKLMANEDQLVRTDIKWENNDDLLRVFVRELLLIIKCDILQRNGDLDRTNLVWFRPLSFMGNIRNDYKNIWSKEPKNVLFVQESQVSCFSESEAPYYYFKKNDDIADSDSVAVIDIGGGSTDFVYFVHNKPQMANSVHFGCDVLWENGFVDFKNAKENGIFRHYVDTLRFERQDLDDLNECFKLVDSASTKDIINFWLSNAEFCDITKRMNQDFKPVFVYHLTSILFYMASMFKDNNLAAPMTVVFSGNGSKYIDNFICQEKNVLKLIVELVFNHVFGGNHSVNLVLPQERKESTCYGGLYRDPTDDDVPEKVYQGDVSKKYETVADIEKNFDTLKSALMRKYDDFNKLYKDVLELLKKQHIIDNTANTSVYVSEASKDMSVPFNTYYKTQVREKYDDEVTLYDSVFFLPIINRIFELTKI